MLRTLMAVLLVISETVMAGADSKRSIELTQSCVACHGIDGNSPAGSFPSIAGQRPKYLIKQLNEIKTGKRSSPLMTGLLDNFSAQDLIDIATYYAEQSPNAGAAAAELVLLGETIYRSGIQRKEIMACTGCHLPQGEGIDSAGFPSLAAQWPEYTEGQLRAFRSGERDNDDKVMQIIARDLSDGEIKAVASYLYGLQ